MQTLTKGLSMFSETVASSLTGTKLHQHPKKEPNGKESNQAQPGVVTIVDVQTIGVRQVFTFLIPCCSLQLYNHTIKIYLVEIDA